MIIIPAANEMIKMVEEIDFDSLSKSVSLV